MKIGYQNRAHPVQNQVGRFDLTWKTNVVEHYKPLLCLGKMYSMVKLLWALAGSSSIECNRPPLVAFLKGKIGVDAVDLHRVQGKEGVLLLVKPWIAKNTGNINDEQINLEELERQHAEVKQFYKVRKQIWLMPPSAQVKVALLVLV